MSEDPLLTIKELAAKLGVSARTIRRYLAKGMPSNKHGGRVLIKLSAGVAWKSNSSNLAGVSRADMARIEAAGPSAEGVTQRPGGVTSQHDEVVPAVKRGQSIRQQLEETKLRKDIALADKAELDRDIKRGKYFPVDHLEKCFAKLGVTIRSRLIGFCGSSARELATMFAEAMDRNEPLDVGDIEDALRAPVEEILSEVSANFSADAAGGAE